jgi:transcriptional regulator with XRE-family HTH domain
MPPDLSHIRRYRKSAYLAQRELAVLVGLGSQHAFSDVELGARRPGLDVAIACALALDVPVDQLFPQLALPVEHDMLTRARKLHNEIVSDPTRRGAAAYLAALIGRLTDQISS